jgi:hypothetical protein
MKATVAILTRWRREDPDRLLEAALRQARELAELLPELDGLRNQNVTKPKKAREPGKSLLRWPPPAPSAPPAS